MGMFDAKIRAEILEQEKREQQERFQRNDEKWYIRGQ